MKKEDGNPFVIQFADLDDFVTEVRAAGVEVVRVWLGQYGTGAQPVDMRYHTVMVQAIDPNQHAVLMTSLVIGSYQMHYGRPFGPTSQRRAAIIEDHQERAQADVEAYLIGKLPDVVLRGGHIFTGLTGPQMSRGYWDGFDHIYEELKQVK